MLITDYEVPITPQCERFLIVVELTNEEAVAKTVEKFMKSDPNATRVGIRRQDRLGDSRNDGR